MKKICREIFGELNSNDIKYCHFKSNMFLNDGLEGNTDLDIVVTEDDYIKFIEIITKRGFKEFEPNEFCKYPGVTNWYGVDQETGVIIHIHLHTHLITGKSLIKEYIIPWRDDVLKNSQESNFLIRIDRPEIELILLFARLVVKRTVKQRTKSNERKVFFPEDEWEEVQYLREHINIDEFKKIYYELLGEQSFSQFSKMILEDDPITFFVFSKFEKLIRNQFASDRRMSSIKAEAASFIYRARRKAFILLNKKFGMLLPVKKRCKSEGPIFAFIGIDGSGKSTMIKEIENWIGEEFDVKKFYLGAGQENASIIAKRLIQIYQKHVEKHEGASSTESNMTRANVSNSDLKDYIKAVFASLTYLMIAKSNLKCLYQAIKLSKDGGVSLCDRMPQSVMEIVHDGMKVQRYSRAFPKSKLISSMAEKEKQIFEKIDAIKCNLYIVRMNVDPEVSYARKKENEKNSNERKIKANTLLSIDYKNARRIIDVDCNQSYDNVLLNIKDAIWRAM